MKIEIRKEIREFILNDVNESLARLGISESMRETVEREIKYSDTIHYEFESAPIRQMPMMFKKLIVKGYMVAVKVEEDSRFAKLAEKNDLVIVNIDYRYQHFDMGENGCSVGRIIYAVKKDLPATFESYGDEDGRSYYVHRIEGLTI